MHNIFYSLVIYPLTQIIELVFIFCDKLFDNTGIAILGVSFAVSLLTLPLYIVAEHWQQVERDVQKKMKGEVDKIKAVFKGNEQYMILSTYYRQNHYHPIMSLRSAFGLLIQIPFFTAAYTCLSNMGALQGEHFLFIRDMGAPDALFTIGSFNVNILPIAMTLINMISGTIYTRGLSLRDKIQTYGLALLFVVILYDSPAGLVMYWTMNNLFSLVKNIFYKMKHPVKTLYYIACTLVTVLIIWLYTSPVLNRQQTFLVSILFALIYPAPLYVKAANYLIDNTFVYLRDNRKMRISLFCLSSIALTFIVGLLIPSQLIASSPEEFSGIDGYGNPQVFVFNTFIQAAGFFIIWASLIFFLYKERMQTLISFFMTLLMGSALLNAFAFPGDYGTLNKLLKFSEDPILHTSLLSGIINLVCVLVLALLISFAIKKNLPKLINYVSSFVIVGIIAVFISNSFTINKGYESYVTKTQQQNNNLNLPKIFHFSKTGKNVLYIYLDRAQARFVKPLFEERPDLNETFSGFTHYENTVSFNGHTLMGSPPCFGGYEYTPESMNERRDTKLVDKINEAICTLPRFFTEQAEGYSATITDPCWANYSWIPDISILDKYKEQGVNAYLTDGLYTDRWYKVHQETTKIAVVSSTLKRNLLWYSFFKVSPLLLRPVFYGNDGNYWSTNTFNDDYNDYLDGYAVLENAVEMTDFECPTPNSYINLVNNSTHDSLFLQAPDYRPVAEVTDFGTSGYKKNASYHSFAGAMLRVGEWLDFLKKNGCYDNTRIVLVADHSETHKEDGYEWDEKFDKIGPGHFHPLLMFKDFNSKGPLKISDEFMTNADGPVLITKGITDNPVNPATGTPLDSSKKADGALVCTDDIFMPYHNKSEYYFTAEKDHWYRVKGNIFKSENWQQEIQK